MGKFTQEELSMKLTKPCLLLKIVLKWALDNLHPKLAKASSFGAEDAVVIDIMLKINSNARLFTLDTGRLKSRNL